MQLLALTLTNTPSFAKAKLIKKSISRCHYFSHDSVSLGVTDDCAGPNSLRKRDRNRRDIIHVATQHKLMTKRRASLIDAS